jgi:hypothetical protein
MLYRPIAATLVVNASTRILILASRTDLITDGRSPYYILGYSVKNILFVWVVSHGNNVLYYYNTFLK